MALILYQRGDYDVRAETFGNRSGFAVYKNGNVHAVRVASIGYPAERGFRRAIAECDKRAAQAV